MLQTSEEAPALLQTILNVVQIILSAALITLTVIQGRGSGLGNMFGGGGSVQQTRRGVEKTMHDLTVVIAVVFFVVSLVSVLV
ncbi:MAG: preprotein translocase subunit SecG [Anaerolineales bacterium]